MTSAPGKKEVRSARRLDSRVPPHIPRADYFPWRLYPLFRFLRGRERLEVVAKFFENRRKRRYDAVVEGVVIFNDVQRTSICREFIPTSNFVLTGL